jgi:hypothetical protein
VGSSASIKEQQGRGGEAGTCGVHARQLVEHMAGSDVGKVGRQFGLALGQIGPQAKNKVCSPHEALRFSLRCLGH